jgi:Homeodomain-like domain
VTETKSRPGRPPKLDSKLAGQIAALLIAGHTTTEVAQIVGVDRRSIARWRARAWSDRETDRDCVELEQMITRGKFAAAEIGQPRHMSKLTPALALQPLHQSAREPRTRPSDFHIKPLVELAQQSARIATGRRTEERRATSWGLLRSRRRPKAGPPPRRHAGGARRSLYTAHDRARTAACLRATSPTRYATPATYPVRD